MRSIGRIARYSAPYFLLINLAVLISWRVFHSDVRFGLILSVICPILCGVVSVLAEKTDHHRPDPCDAFVRFPLIESSRKQELRKRQTKRSK